MRSSPLEIVVRLTEAVGTAPTLPAVYEAALHGLKDGFGVDRASILLFDQDGVMRFKAWRGVSDAYRAAVEGHTPWSPGQAPPDPIVVSDITADPSLAAYLPVFQREQIASLAFVPLISDGGVIGKFMLYGDRPRALAWEELAAARAIGFLLGFAVERTRRIDEADRQRERVLFALDAAAMGTWDWDIPTDTVRWSDNLERIHGLPPGTFTGNFRSYEQEIHPEDRARVLDSLRQALAVDTPHDEDYRIVAPDGTVRWVMGKGRVERDAAGVPVRMTGVCMDITPRKTIQAENSRLLKESTRLLAQEEALRDKLTQLTDGSRALLTTLDADSVVSEVLALAARVIPADAYAVWRREGDVWKVAGSIGLSARYVSIALPADQGHYKFDAPIIASNLREHAVLEGRMTAYGEEGIASLVSVPLAVRGAIDGSVVFYYRQPYAPTEAELRVAIALGHLSAAAMSNAELYSQQRVLRALAEASEERTAFLAEASIRLSSLDYEASLRALAELSVPRMSDWCAVDLKAADDSLKRVGVAHVDPEKTRLIEEIQARYPINLSSPRGLGHVLRTGEPELYSSITDELLVSGAIDDRHLAMLREVGMRSIMLVPLLAPSGVLGGLTFVSTREDRLYDEADLAFASELGRRAGLAIENARLFAEAQSANRLKDEFVATLSHELRTPLNVIVGRAQMLRSVDDASVARQHAEAIVRNSTTLSRLVDDLLDISRMTVGQIKLDRQVVDPAAIIEAAVQTIQGPLEAKGLRLAIDIDPGIPSVIGDATRIQQIVWNLLTNAIKFTPHGGSIALTCSRDGERACLAVTDSGEGLSAEMLPHVFEMFWQAGTAGARRQAGLGLGLSIVRKLAELHGGEVTATSDGPGCGATFRVWLPLQGAVVARREAAAT